MITSLNTERRFPAGVAIRRHPGPGLRHRAAAKARLASATGIRIGGDDQDAGSNHDQYGIRARAAATPLELSGALLTSIAESNFELLSVDGCRGDCWIDRVQRDASSSVAWSIPVLG